MASYSDSSGISIARTGIGTVIGRKSTSKDKEYIRIWIYIPTRVSEDTGFPFEVGDPCEVELDLRKKQLIIKTISEDLAYKKGWARRKRGKS